MQSEECPLTDDHLVSKMNGPGQAAEAVDPEAGMSQEAPDALQLLDIAENAEQAEAAEQFGSCDTIVDATVQEQGRIATLEAEKKELEHGLAMEQVLHPPHLCKEAIALPYTRWFP